MPEKNQRARRPGSFLVLCFGLALGTTACGDSDTDDGDVLTPTLSSIEQNIFQVSCNSASCHSAAGEQGNLILEPGMAFAELVDVDPDNEDAVADGFKLVTPGVPATSFLVTKLVAPLDPRYDSLMPLGSRDGLDPAMVDVIRTWISNGALND